MKEKLLAALLLAGPAGSACHISAQSESGPTDMTSRIVNPGFEAGTDELVVKNLNEGIYNATGWTMVEYSESEGGYDHSRVKSDLKQEGEYSYRFRFRWGASHSMSFKQTLEDMPAGRYMLSAFVNLSNSNDVNGTWIYVKNADGEEIGRSAEKPKVNDWTNLSVAFNMLEKGTFDIGGHCTGTNPQGYESKFWFDNFTLTYMGTGSEYLKSLISDAEKLIEEHKDVDLSALSAAVDKARAVAENADAEFTEILEQEEAMKAAMAEAEKLIEIAQREDEWSNVPYDITSFVNNPSFENGNLSGWTTNGFQIQNNDKYPGQKDGTWYCERWVAKGTNMPASSVFQILEDLPNGKYEVRMNAGIRMQSATGGEDELGSGLYVTANNSSVHVDQILSEYTVFAGVMDHKLKFGVEAKDAVGNHAYIDNVRVIYHGGDLAAYKSILEMSLERADKVQNSEQKYFSELVKLLDEAVENGKSAVVSDDSLAVIAAINNLDGVLSQVNMSIHSYEMLKDYIEDLNLAAFHYKRPGVEDYYNEMQAGYDGCSFDSERIAEEIAKKDSVLYTEVLEAVDNDIYEIKDRFDVDYVESGFPVSFSQTFAGDNHYIAYYDKDKNFCIGYRKLTDRSFKKTILNSKIGWDTHNYTTLIVDKEGYIHVSGNMHNVQIKYWRSERPYDASSFKAIHYMTGSEEDKATYPVFLMTAEGDLLYHYRYGASGSGYEVYNIWKPETQTWERFLDKPLIDGEGQRNAYMRGPYYENGYYHLYWLWRSSADCASNHDFSYARSKDLIHWESVDGQAVGSPIKYSDKVLNVDAPELKYGNGMLNNVPKHTFDSKGRIVLCNMKYDEYGNSQLYAYRYNESEGKWDEVRVSNWVYRFNFSGIGSVSYDIYASSMRNLGNGELGVSYTHKKYGAGEIIIDEETLQPKTVREFTRSYPLELSEVTTEGTYSKPVSVSINKSGNYILRWETLGSNYDQKPSGTLPPPYMMELIEIAPKEPVSINKVESSSGVEAVQIADVINVRGTVKGENITLSDVSGKVVYRCVADGKSVNIPSPEAGIYIVSTEHGACKLAIR